MFAIGGGEAIWVRFSYECLPNLCYICDRLGHIEKECSFIKAGEAVLELTELPYGAWLRAGVYGSRSSTDQAKVTAVVADGCHGAKG